jgi:hypothetical protein
MVAKTLPLFFFFFFFFFPPYGLCTYTLHLAAHPLRFLGLDFVIPTTLQFPHFVSSVIILVFRLYTEFSLYIYIFSQE